jgi:rubrerythrin
MSTETNAEAINRVRETLFDLMREKAEAGDIGARRFLITRYSMVICAAGHHLTGEGEPPTECPICKERGIG